GRAEDYLAALRVVDRQRRHAVEAQQHVLAPVAPCRQDHLGVGLGLEFFADRLELLAQLEEIVDLAVVDDDMTAVGGGHRLVAARTGIDDGKAAKAERDMELGAEPVAGAIGPAMRDLVREVADFGLLDGTATEIKDPGNSTHDDVSCSGGNRIEMAAPRPIRRGIWSTANCVSSRRNRCLIW